MDPNLPKTLSEISTPPPTENAGQKIIMFGLPTCPDCLRIKKFFTDNAIEYEYHDLETDKVANDWVSNFAELVPILIMLDGSLLYSPSNEELLGKINSEESNGKAQMVEPQIFDTIIIGAGPAGITAAIYAVRKALKVLVISQTIGGQAAYSGDVENYPGFTMITGADLAQKFKEDIDRFKGEGLWIKDGVKVTSIHGQEGDFRVKTDQSLEYQSKTVIVASGRNPRFLGIKGEKEFLGKGVATCATCLPPEEGIIANSSIKSISDVKEQQRVLTHDGTYQTISNKTKRYYSGELVTIQLRYFSEPVSLTPNHPVLKRSLIKGNGTNYFKFKWSDPEWIQAGRLIPGDILYYPIVKETKKTKQLRISDLLDINISFDGMAYAKKETYSSHRVPNKILINRDFLRLVGYYLAEGSITNRGVNFYFHKKEIDYINDVTQIIRSVFGLDVTISYENNVARIMVFSKIVQELFEKLFGKYSFNKKLPHFMVVLPPKLQKEIVIGFFRGDGCLRYKDFVLVTNSRNLVYQFRDILLRLDILPRVEVIKLEKLKKSKINSREIFFRHDKYQIYVGGIYLDRMSKILGVQHPRILTKKRSCEHAWIKDGNVLLPIRKISVHHYTGDVFNFAVARNNTYVAKNFTVHNCDGPLFKGKEIAIVGGGNSALDAASYLQKLAKTITIINITEDVKGDEELVKTAKTSPNITILNNTTVTEIFGENFVTGIKVEDNNTHEEKTLNLAGVFIEIGWIPSVDFAQQLAKDKQNQIIVNEFGETSVPGIWAAGDVNNLWGEQIVVAAGEGAKVALSVAEHIAKIPHQASSNVHEG